jgi:RND family efflux transporter MFP subunit
MMPHRERSQFLTLLAAVALAGLPLGCSRAPAPEETAPPAPVKWMEARQMFIEEWTEVVGTTQPLPNRAARITAPLEGRVVWVLGKAKDKSAADTDRAKQAEGFVEGQKVKAGDAIVQLDASLAKANRDKLKAAWEKLPDQEKLAELAVDAARIEVNRLKKLKAERITVAESDIQKAENLLKVAQIKQDEVKFDRETAKAELDAAEVQVRLHTLTAPINGRLGRLLVVPGQTLTPGTMVADVVNIDDQIDVLCFVPPRVAKLLQKGQTAHVGGVGEQPAGKAGPKGTVEFIADQAEVDTGNFAVKVRFLHNKDLGLRANTTVRLRVQTTPGKACLTLPESALVDDQGAPAVIVVEDYKKVVKTEDGKEITLGTPEAEKLEKEGELKGKEMETGKARKLRVKLGIRDRVLHLVEVVGLDDPEKKWKGSLETTRFVVEKGQGLRTGDAIKLEVEEEEE